jgi:pSer/pThr/pTyr-binding forkhead associated (FHA) protein
MGSIDFPTWMGVGCYGGLVCSLVVAAGIAGYALRLRRGTPRQLARAMLASLIYACAMFAPIWWDQSRFDLLGPSLAASEVGFWLVWTALLGWALPFGTALGYVLIARPQPLTGMVPAAYAGGAVARGPAVDSHPSSINDPGRLIEPLGPGAAWGHLVPPDGPFSQRPVPLTRLVTLLGREVDCDIIVPDDQASRHHAELRWDHGRVHLVDRGSLNGTRVNGQGVLGQVPLRAGDVIEIGAQRYRVELAQAVPGQTPSPAPQNVDVEETRKVPGAARAASPVSNPVPRLALVALSGPQSGTRWEVGAALVSIGRDSDSDVSLPNSSVSRHHAQIVRQASGYYVQDLDSQNGTLLNGQPLSEPTPLRPGDVLQVGEVALRCEPLRPTPVTDPNAGLPPSVQRAPFPVQAASAPDIAAPMLPDTHMLLAPRFRYEDRPHLAPPRLLPPQSPTSEE